MISWLRRLRRALFRPALKAWRNGARRWKHQDFVEAVWSLRCRENEKRNVAREREWFMLRHLNAIERAAMFGTSVA